MIFNTRSIRSRLNEEEWKFTQSNEYRFRTVFLGRSGDILPSGKICFDDDLSPQKDQDWYAQVDRELNSIGCVLDYNEDFCYVVDKKFIIYDNVKFYAKEMEYLVDGEWLPLYVNEFKDMK